MTSPYQLIDNMSGRVVGTYKTLRAASRRANHLDNVYGAVRYIVRRASWPALKRDDILASVEVPTP